MASDAKLARRGSLDAFADELQNASSDAIRIEPLPFRSVVNLRGRVTEEFSAAIEAATGVALPLEPNRWLGDGHHAAIWLGPDEWLLVAPDGEADMIERSIRAARPNGRWLSLVDVSHNYTSMLLSGPCVRDLLAKGCALDLHPRVFVSGDCAQTLLAKTRVFLCALDDATVIEVFIGNSFSPYTVQWLLDASAEFQAAEAAKR
ncbi:MAG: sarcosine oxidase subunit gamma [Steroidobacteraceae bacterium]